MVKSLYPQPIMITTVDPVPADSRFYAVNERIHRFPILKPNALTEVGPRVTCSQPLQTMDSKDIPYSGRFSLGANFQNFRRLISNHENINCEKWNRLEILMMSL